MQGLLKKEHFASKSRTVVFGAMDALAGSPRRDGMEGLVEAMRSKEVKYGFDIARGFFRATGWSVSMEGRPYGYVHRLCLKWWDENGAAFLKERRGGE